MKTKHNTTHQTRSLPLDTFTYRHVFTWDCHYHRFKWYLVFTGKAAHSHVRCDANRHCLNRCITPDRRPSTVVSKQAKIPLGIESAVAHGELCEPSTTSEVLVHQLIGVARRSPLWICHAHDRFSHDLGLSRLHWSIIYRSIMAFCVLNTIRTRFCGFVWYWEHKLYEYTHWICEGPCLRHQGI